jgi:hypothetical protein
VFLVFRYCVPFRSFLVSSLWYVPFVSMFIAFKVYYQVFFWVLIDLIVELLVLIIKSFDIQTENGNPVSNDLIIKSFDISFDNQ